MKYYYIKTISYNITTYYSTILAYNIIQSKSHDK